jgi:hypothetical protein
MTRSWLEHAAAFIVLWFALAIITGVVIAAGFRHGARELPPAPDEEDQP